MNVKKVYCLNTVNTVFINFKSPTIFSCLHLSIYVINQNSQKVYNDCFLFIIKILKKSFKIPTDFLTGVTCRQRYSIVQNQRYSVVRNQ